MIVNGTHYRTVWMQASSVCLNEPDLLPFEFRVFRPALYRDTCEAITAHDYGMPLDVAAPVATIDFGCASGADIPIEHRHENEALYQKGTTADGKLETVLVASPGSDAINPAFDVTPAELVTAIIPEQVIYQAHELAALEK